MRNVHFLRFRAFSLKNVFQKKTSGCKGKLTTKRNATPSVQRLNIETILQASMSEIRVTTRSHPPA